MKPMAMFCFLAAAWLASAGHMAGQTPLTASFVARAPSGPLEESQRRGSQRGDRFLDAPKDSSVLIGFIAYRGPQNRDVIVGLRGIYLGPRGRVVGPLHGSVNDPAVTIEARSGYAVSGLGVKSDWAVNGFEVFFMKLLRSADALDPADFYVSDYVGGQGGGEIRYCANDGRLVVGYGAQAGQDLNAISLYQPPPASLDPPPVKILAADDAGDYKGDWEKTPSRGAGFGPWEFSASDAARETAGFGIGTSTSNGPPIPSGGIDVAGQSWMMHAAESQTAAAVRKFVSGPLRPGQQLCVSMDNGDVGENGRLGFSLQNAAGQDRLEFYFSGAGKNYFVRCNGADVDLGLARVVDGINVIFTQLANNHFMLDVRGANHFSAIPGVITLSDISQIKLYDQGAGDTESNGLFWNTLAIRQLLPAAPANR
jgi:hypothetical protein